MLVINVPGLKEKEEMEDFKVGEDREREAKIAVEEVPSTDAMVKSVNGVETGC